MTDLTRSGTSTARVTISSYPGESVKIVGYVVLQGAYATLSHVEIDGSNTLSRAKPAARSCRPFVSLPLTIAGHDDVLEYVNYFQSVRRLRGNGIGIGFWGNADNTIIRYSRIHDVGRCEAYDHLIYLSHGNNVQIYGNWIWNDAHGRGVQLYPGPTNARVFGNVVDRVGEGFVIGNESGDQVSGNQIFDNVISNSRGLRWEHVPAEAIHDLYVGSAGGGNAFFDNVSFHNRGGIGRVSRVRMYGNVKGNPHYANGRRHDYRLKHSVVAIVASLQTRKHPRHA